MSRTNGFGVDHDEASKSSFSRRYAREEKSAKKASRREVEGFIDKNSAKREVVSFHEEDTVQRGGTYLELRSCLR